MHLLGISFPWRLQACEERGMMAWVVFCTITGLYGLELTFGLLFSWYLKRYGTYGDE
jgi:hypothetical protein